ncbi:hypothetical protein DyAD56_21030 [Dyella sp. AD56]|uniref:DUF1028 domain-containing protein n=2 Tax=unclassified Dyella TaxID=2634549 RepID=UPI000CB3D302|nr:DUF1028 domain-containing protein [Dyella sp. AD56]PMQ03209.1 hypothetical protein DyAD56_21030 [Dyella sp. AD56]
MRVYLGSWMGVLCLALWIMPLPASATFSIVACDPAGNCGVAVATDNLAVGATVPYAQARTGALVSQFETNPSYGPKGLALLATGIAPDAVIQRLLDGDGDFDGTTIAERQVGIVDASGRSASYSGDAALAASWSGARHGEGYAVQGNGLAGASVLEAMEKRFLAAHGALGARLMAGLEAAQAAGGQTIGRMSAALLVRTVDGGWQDIDLRVDGSPEPLTDLRRLLDQHYAWQAIVTAERQWREGHAADARASMALALQGSHGWDRVWRRGARLAMSMGDTERALDCLATFVATDPIWARSELQDELYAPLRGNRHFDALLRHAQSGARPVLQP